MLKLGNIFHVEPLINHKKLEYINYDDFNGLVNYSNLHSLGFKTNNLPSLFIGWKSLKTIFPLDILNKHLAYTSYWEFSPSEDIIGYTEGLDKFVKKLPEYYISNFKYINADPFFLQLFSLEAIKSLIPDGGDLYIYKNDMAYYRSGAKIYGFKLPVFEYVGMNKDEIVSTLKSKAKNHLLDDSTEYQKYYKQFPEFPLLKRSMVVFLFS